MPLPRLRRPSRAHSRDDDDWGTSSPEDIMDPSPSPPPSIQPPLPTPDRSLTAILGRIKQQDLKSYTCTFSPRCVISLYFTIALVFLPLGVAIVAGTARLRDMRVSYNDKCEKETCTVKFNTSRAITPNSYLYYTLSNYHQNAREYVKSRSDVMDQGQIPKVKLDVENCDRWLCEENPEAGTHCLGDPNGGLNTDAFIYPCGLTARSLFNDTFVICKVPPNDDQCDDKVKISEKGIAWGTDVKYKFRPGDDPEFSQENQYLCRTANDLLTDEHFIVWMRLSAFSTFDKLYAIIEEELEAGRLYYMMIKNNYNVSGFGGGKGFFITQTTWFGNGNGFLGTAYLIVGMTSLIIAIILLLKHVINPSSPTNIDPSLLLREHLAKLEVSDPLHRQ